MRRKLSIVLALAFMAGLTGCEKSGGSSTTETIVSTMEDDISEEETEAIEEQAEQSEESTTEGEEPVEVSEEEGPVTISFEYKEDSRKDADGNIILEVYYRRPHIQVNGNEDASAAIEQVIADDEEQFFINSDSLEQEAAQVYEAGLLEDMPPYANDVNYVEKRVDDKVISLERHNYSNTGGAHGNIFVSGLNFDTRTGEKLTIADIAEDKDVFMAGVKEYVLKICQSDAYKDRLIPEYEEYLDFVLQDDLWFFDREGITFIANTYELAAYAEGTLFFTVPYSELEGLKPEYAYAGGFQISAGLGETISIDLDGDGTKDEIIFDAEYTDDYAYVSSLKINGADYSQVLEDNQCYILYPYEKYVVLDIDDSDDTLEIALQDYGMSEDPRTTFFRYEAGRLTCLGSINDRLSDLHLVNDGDGVLQARERMRVFETAMVQVSYTLNNDKLERDMKSLYPVRYYDGAGIGAEKTLLQDFVVYETMSTQGEQITLSKDSVVTVIATDDAEWMQIKDAENQVYYVHLIDGFSVEVNGEAVFAGEVFDALCMAD